MNPTISKPNLVDAHVLLVEDDRMVADALLELLRLFGCHTAHARSVSKAREAIANTRRGFDAAVIDLSLPDGSGAALVPMLHGSPLPCAVLLVTGLPGAIATGLALAAEAHELLCKPLHAADFATRLSSTVSGTARLRHGQPVRDLMLAEFETVDGGRIDATTTTTAQMPGPDSAPAPGEDQAPIATPPRETEAPRSDYERSRPFYESCHRFLDRYELTPAQARIFPALIAGYDDELIADLLDNPVASVRSHARDIVLRLGLGSRGELAPFFRASSIHAGTGPWPSRTTSISSSKNRSTVEGSGHR